MIIKNDILSSIKKTVKSVDPTATVILYGSFARGDNDKDSDIDLLILVDNPRLTPQESKKIKYPLYDIEFETGQIISPLVLTRKDWETRHKITPFYENVTREGRTL
jgi:predicted nucleotidyltransferase